jgi:transcriptional regulator GlxA family with amidase domain
MTRCVRLLIYPGFVLLDLSGPLEVFANAGRMTGQSYDLRVLSLTGGMIRSSCGLSVATERLTAEPTDTLIVVGASELPEGPWLDELAAAIARASRLARRTASVCTGAFLLAASGVLDGRAATTHWFYAPQLRARYPTLRVDGDHIYTRDAGVWTSAGMSSGIDMALAMVEEDLGKDTAQAVARMLVVYYRRPGGQYQFSSLLDFDPGSDRIRRTLSFARENLPADLSVERLAGVAGLSVRQFGRAFSAATGISPAKAIEHLRVEIARTLVEDGRQTFHEIARRVGFTGPDRMRLSFLRVLGRTPLELRRGARRTALPHRRQA